MGFENKINGKIYDKKASLVRSLRKLGYTPKQYYDEFIKTENEGYCKYCGNETKFLKFKYQSFCTAKCCGKYNNNTGKMWNSLDEKDRNKLIHKMSESAKESHPPGGEWLDKRNQTYLEKYGKSEQEYRVDFFKNRMVALTPEEKKAYYDKAVINSMKARNCYKEYTLNGTVIKIRGYENYVLDTLKYIIPEENIKAGSKIGFYRYIDFEGIQRRYFPDIIIDDILIEVKSPYTLTTDKNLLFKLTSMKNQGFKPLLVIWEPKQKEMCEKDLIETISSQALRCEGRFNDYPFIGVGYKHMITEALGAHYGL